mmetsp:Transcript_36473/g.76898  ORF Transcript_36473/g.76898 Transcript_36473/m.76898 type:complete len:207 (+) Transcript_36473:536-1156(+)
MRTRDQMDGLSIAQAAHVSHSRGIIVVRRTIRRVAADLAVVHGGGGRGQISQQRLRLRGLSSSRRRRAIVVRGSIILSSRASAMVRGGIDNPSAINQTLLLGLQARHRFDLFMERMERIVGIDFDGEVRFSSGGMDEAGRRRGGGGGGRRRRRVVVSGSRISISFAVDGGAAADNVGLGIGGRFYSVGMASHCFNGDGPRCHGIFI